MSIWIRTYLSIACLTATIATAAYVEPKFDGIPIAAEKVSISATARDGIATDLARAVCNTDGFDAKHLKWATRALAIAIHLAPENRAAVIANAELKRSGKAAKIAGDHDRAVFCAKLLRGADFLADKGGSDNLALAGFLYSLASSHDPVNKDALFKLETFSRDHKVDWSPIEGADAAQATPFDPPPKKAVRPPNGIATFQRRQGKANGLFVTELPNGLMAGTVIEIICTVTNQPDPQRNILGFARPVGKEMFTAFEEAKRLMDVRYPRTRGGFDIRVSFSDKYTPKDGGSAGLAFALLFVSLYDDIELDEKVAVTGDITVDGKVREIGGVMAKIRGARDYGCHTVILPDTNEQEFTEGIMLHGPDLLSRVQVFSASTLDEALAIARNDRQGDLAEVTSQFAKVATYLQRSPDGVRTNAKVRAALQDILRTHPNHLSAKLLLRYYGNRMPNKLSTATALEESFVTFQPYLKALRSQYRPGHADYAVADDVREGIDKQLSRIGKLAPDDIAPLVEDFQKYAKITDELESLAKRRRTGSTDRMRAALQRQENDQRQKVNGRIEQLLRNNEIVQKLFR